MLINSINNLLGHRPTSKKGKSKNPELWVDYNYFCKAAKSISDYNKRNFKKRRRFDFNRSGEINLLTVCDADREKYGILTDNDKILQLIEVIKAQEAESRKGKWVYTVDADTEYKVYCDMKIASNEFHAYSNQIKELYNLSAQDCQRYAKRWAVWVWIIENYSRFKLCLETYYNAYCKVFPDHFKAENGKISFHRFMTNCEDNGIASTIVDKRAVVKVQKRRPELQMAFLQTIYTQSRKVKAADAFRKLQTYCKEIGQQTISYSNVKIIWKEFENNITLYAARYGMSAAQKQLPYASLLRAEHRNTQWQVDGWTLPFWGNKFQRYVLYLIIDNHSRKITGYSFAMTENSTMILDALEDSMRNTGVFPGEIISDKHSFHRTEIAARIKSDTERMGAIWTVAEAVTRNGIVERYNNYLNDICKDFDGYLGNNITAKGKDARPSQEALTISAKPGNWKTEEEIKAIAVYAVKEFNKSPLTALNGLSPNEAYTASEDKKCFTISDDERLKLVRPVSTYKVQRGQINIKVGMRKHEFQLPAELISLYNNRLLTVVYEDLTQGIYVSDPRTGEELGCIPPKQKIPGAIPDQTEEHKRHFNKLAGRTNGVNTQARKKAQESIADALSDNPEAIALINSHSLPKDIRALAMKDIELRRDMAEHGVNVNLIPIRAQKQPIDTNAQQVSGKSKERPFTPESNVMRTMTIDEILGNIEK